MHVVKIYVKVPVLVAVFRMVAHGVLPVAIMRKILMMPVYKRIVQANLKPFGACSVNKFSHYVAPKLCVCGFEIGGSCVEQAKTVMMLGGEYNVLHSGGLCGFCPGLSVKRLRVEFIKVLHVFFLGHFLAAPYPFSPCGYGVQAPMYEHAEARVKEPSHSAFVFASVKSIHMNHLKAELSPLLYLRPFESLLLYM